MLKLHGGPLSIFYNIARQAILEKGIDCEFVAARPSQEPDFLAKSPMGKVPMLETAQGFLSETDTILDYLEEACGGPRLLPDEPFARAKVRQLMKTQELYVEAPLHPLIGVYFGRTVPAHVREEGQPAARRGLAALARLTRFSPWVCGAELTQADIFLFHSITLAQRLALEVYDWDPLAEVPGLQDWYQRFAARDATRLVMADYEEAVAQLTARMQPAV